MVKDKVIGVRMSAAEADAIETRAARRGTTVSQLLRHLAVRDTDVDERCHDDPVEFDSELIERTAAGLAGYGGDLIKRVATATPEERERILHMLIGYVIYLAAPRSSAEEVYEVGQTVARHILRLRGQVN